MEVASTDACKEYSRKHYESVFRHSSAWFLCCVRIAAPDRPYQAKQFHVRFIVGEKAKGGSKGEVGGERKKEVRRVFLLF